MRRQLIRRVRYAVEIQCGSLCDMGRRRREKFSRSIDGLHGVRSTNAAYIEINVNRKSVKSVHALRSK